MRSAFQCRLCGASRPQHTFEPCEPLQPIASAITRTGRIATGILAFITRNLAKATSEMSSATKKMVEKTAALAMQTAKQAEESAQSIEQAQRHHEQSLMPIVWLILECESTMIAGTDPPERGIAVAGHVINSGPGPATSIYLLRAGLA